MDDFDIIERPGKFEGEPAIVERLYEMLMEDQQDEIIPDERFGVYAMFRDVETDEGKMDFIIEENDQGFVSIVESGYGAEVQATWDLIEEDYDKWIEKHGGDE